MKQGVRSLYSSTMDDYKMEWLNEGMVNLAGIGIMSVIIIILWVIHVLSLNKLFDISEKYKNVTNKIVFRKAC